MGDDDNLDFLESVLAHTRAAAGLPADWGDTRTPLSAEEELEDAPPPALLRTGMTTAQLLPYGSTVRMPDGTDVVVERVVAPPVVTPRGLVWAFDPMSDAWQGVALKVQLRGGLQPVEVAVLRHETPRDIRSSAAVAVIGDVSRVTRWTTLPTRLSVDAGCGAFAAADRAGDLVAIAGAMSPPYVPEGVAPAIVDDVVVGAFFDPGDGPWGHEVMVGHGRHPVPEALLVDLHVLPR